MRPATPPSALVAASRPVRVPGPRATPAGSGAPESPRGRYRPRTRQVGGRAGRRQPGPAPTLEPESSHAKTVIRGQAHAVQPPEVGPQPGQGVRGRLGEQLPDAVGPAVVDGCSVLGDSTREAVGPATLHDLRK